MACLFNEEAMGKESPATVTQGPHFGKTHYFPLLLVKDGRDFTT